MGQFGQDLRAPRRDENRVLELGRPVTQHPAVRTPTQAPAGRQERRRTNQSSLPIQFKSNGAESTFDCLGRLQSMHPPGL